MLRNELIRELTCDGKAKFDELVFTHLCRIAFKEEIKEFMAFLFTMYLVVTKVTTFAVVVFAVITIIQSIFADRAYKDAMDYLDAFGRGGK